MQIEVDKLVGPVYGNVELMSCIYLASFQPLSLAVAIEGTALDMDLTCLSDECYVTNKQTKNQNEIRHLFFLTCCEL